MIPILYPADEASKGTSAFKSNGLGRLIDAATCVVTEKRNAEYELEMTYPIDGAHFSDIKVDMFIDAVPADFGNIQHFRIYEIEEPIDGVVTIHAEHISYLLTKVIVLPFNAYSATDAMLNLRNNLQWNTGAKTFKTFPFTFETDMNDRRGTVKIESPMSVRSALGGTEGSILDGIGGEYEFDNFTVKLHAARGNDTGVVLRYGKNITDLTNTYDISGAYTGILPYWKGNLDETSSELDENYNVKTESVETVLYVTSASEAEYKRDNTKCTHYLNGKTLWIANADNIYAYPLAVPVDLSGIELAEYEAPELEREMGDPDVDEDDETEEAFGRRVIEANRQAEAEYKQYVLTEFTKAANEYLTENAKKAPRNTIKISFVNLADTIEYEDIAALEHVRLCDKVKVFYPQFDIEVTTKVIETVYDVLSERYESVTLGDVVNNAAETILSNLGATEEHIAGSIEDDKRTMATVIKESIARATELIRGGLGGYIVFSTNAAGEPNEMLIMDAPTKARAKNVWRWNLGGLGFSDNGYNGPFDKIALTMNGEINASRILTGNLDAVRIRTGILQDIKGYNYWDLDSGEFRMATAMVKGSDGQYYDIASEKDITNVNNAVALARQVADGKIKTYIQNAAPTSGLTTGDLWIDSDDNNKTYRWNGTRWVQIIDVNGTASTIANNVAAEKIKTYDEVTLNQQAVFNKLTNKGTIQGLYMQNGQLYVNAEYVSSGTFKTADKANGQVSVLMEGSTAAIKGYLNTALIGLIDTVNGTNASTAKMVVSAKNALAFLTPKLLVKQISGNPTSSQSDVYTGATMEIEVPYYIASYGSSTNGINDLNIYVTKWKFVNGILVGMNGAAVYNSGASTFDAGGGSGMVERTRATKSSGFSWPYNKYPCYGELRAAEYTVNV